MRLVTTEKQKQQQRQYQQQQKYNNSTDFLLFLCKSDQQKNHQSTEPSVKKCMSPKTGSVWWLQGQGERLIHTHTHTVQSTDQPKEKQTRANNAKVKKIF